MSKLFEPTRIGTMELSNRIVMPAMATRSASDTGAITERQIAYYTERAKGGAGLIIVEDTCVAAPLGKHMATMPCIDDDKYLPGLNGLAEAIQSHGAKAAVQLYHAGRMAAPAYTEGKQPVSPSEFYNPATGIKARALTVSEIEALTESFGVAALRAKRAGFNAVEFHGAHGYLLAQFLSPYVNKRVDGYGGDLERRMRFPLEVIEATRGKVGEDYPLSFRISGDEFISGGLTIDETKLISRRLEKGGIDVIHVSGGLPESPHGTIPPMAIPRGCFVHLAEQIKKVVSIPVITVGRINDPALAEEILQEGKADLVSMARALLADPELPRKAIRGELDEIRKCIACNYCLDRGSRGLRIGCAVNPCLLKEREYRIEVAKQSRNVVVIGGGPAGMEAARVATLRGHSVTLLERKSQLGGQLRLAAVPPNKEEIKSLTNWLTYQIEKLAVSIRLSTEATPSLVEALQPDAVIVAAGANPSVPNIPGLSEAGIVTAWDVLEKDPEVGHDVIVAGGGDVGCETAEYLAEHGKKVTIVEMLDEVAMDLEKYSRRLLVERLREAGVKIMTGLRIQAIQSRTARLSDRSGRSVELSADTIVLALGLTPNKALAQSFRDEFPEVHVIGDCLAPRRIPEAIREGFEVAFNL